MGQYNSLPVLEEWLPKRMPFSREHNLNEWSMYERNKNFRYWSSQATVIPVEFYPAYSKGYLYGYYFDKDYCDIDNDEYIL